MSWENSKTTDIVWGARKEVLSARDVIQTLMDILDPIGCERQGLDRYGEPLEREEDTFTTLDFLCELDEKLGRANSALREVGSRLNDALEEWR